MDEIIFQQSVTPYVCTFGVSLTVFQQDGCGTSETCRCGLSGQSRFPQARGNGRGITSIRVAGRSAEAALDQRLAGGSVIGASGE